MEKPRPTPITLIFFGFFILWGFGYETVWQRLSTDIDGTVVSSRDIPSAWSRARHGTEYVFRDNSGKDFLYTAGPTDASLPRNLAIGSHIKKLRWHWTYELDGEDVKDEGIAFYAFSLALAIGCMTWGIRLRRLSNPTNLVSLE